MEEKTVTVCFGLDFVNVNFINFCATRKEIAQVCEFYNNKSNILIILVVANRMKIINANLGEFWYESANVVIYKWRKKEKKKVV